MSLSATSAVKRSSLGRKLLLAGIGLVILLVVLFFVATSSAFLRAVMLPRVGSAIGAKITAADVSLSTSSQLVITQPKVETIGTEPLFTAQTVRVRYRLMDILRGNINVREVTVAAPTVQIVQNPDGTSNLDPILAALKTHKKPKPPKPSKPEKPRQLDVRNVALNQVTLRWIQNQKGGRRQVAELDNLQISVDKVKNGQPGKLTLGADAQYEQAGASNGAAPNLIAAKLAGTCDFALDSALLPESIKAQLEVKKLLVEDPEHHRPQTPWGAQFQLDGALKDYVLDLHQLRVALAPTARAKNELDARGRFDFSRPGAASGKLSVTADSLDLTPLYDLLARPARSNAAPRPVVAESHPRAASANVEPAPVKLPFQRFALDLNIGRLYLREVAVTNWTATTAIDHGQVTLKPFQLTLNGAPVTANATLNLGVPGYTYDVSFQADRIPMEPLANTFSPTYAGQARGDLFAQAQLEGAGVTGAGLRRALRGQCSLRLTNADLRLVSPRMNVLLLPIVSLLRVSEIMQSPLNSIEAQLAAANGKINLTGVGVESAAFHAYTQGSITLAEVLTNSPINHLPVDFYLNRGIAGRAHLLTPGTDPNAAFVKLPNFLKIGGTVGAPRAETDDLVITGLIAGSAAGFVGGKAGRILQGVGDILSGGKQRFTGPPTNSTPDTNAPPRVINPLNLLNNVFKK